MGVRVHLGIKSCKKKLQQSELIYRSINDKRSVAKLRAFSEKL